MNNYEFGWISKAIFSNELIIPDQKVHFIYSNRSLNKLTLLLKHLSLVQSGFYPSWIRCRKSIVEVKERRDIRRATA